MHHWLREIFLIILPLCFVWASVITLMTVKDNWITTCRADIHQYTKIWQHRLLKYLNMSFLFPDPQMSSSHLSFPDPSFRTPWISSWSSNKKVPHGRAGVPSVHILNYTHINSVQLSRSVVSDSLQPHGLQHARLPCPSLSPRDSSNSRPWSHLILCCPLLLLPSFFPSIRVFSNESVRCIRWPNYWSFSLSISSFHFLLRTDFL